MPGELARDSLTHVAYGADAVCFFQWRQAAAGAEKYYSAMLPHAGEDSAVFRAVTDLGRRLHELAPVAGTPRTPAQVAIVFDWESWWAVEQDCHPSGRVRYRQEALDWYTALLDLGIRVDVVPVIAPVERYRVLIAPMLHLVPRTLAQRLVAFVHAGGHLVTTYFSGIVDENDHVWPGGYPGALRDLLGIRIEAFAPLLDGDSVELDNGTTGTLWTDHLTVTDDATEILAGYETGDQAGRPAITRRPVGAGTAAYVSTRLDPEDLCVVVPELLAKTGVRSELPPSLRGHLELAVRGGHRFLLNRTESTVKVHEAARQLLPALPATIPPFGVLVVSDQS
jgi:beta-galactosidase